MAQIKRLIAQVGFFLLQNPFLKNFITGKIYQGNLKTVCSPGLNCYSCPAAAFSCPIGAAQLFLAGAARSVSLYATGFLLVAGALFGRFICGYVCPIGLLQDLAYKIKAPKLAPRLRFLKYGKYIVLIVFVLVLPFTLRSELSGLGEPWFCKYICPSGTLFGAVPLVAVNGFLRRFLGAQFVLKLSLALGIIVGSVFIFRPFCRMLCPLGAIYALMNKFALLRMRCDKTKCSSCGGCEEACGVKIKPASQPNDPECVRCGKCVGACAEKALSYTIKN